MNFLKATVYDIFLVSRGEELKQLVNSIYTLQEYNQMNDSDSEGRAVDLMLENEPLSLDDVEEFAKYNLDKDGNCCMYDSNKTFSTRYDGLLYETVNITFDQYKDYSLNESGGIHQLQYDSYKYIGKHA